MPITSFSDGSQLTSVFEYVPVRRDQSDTMNLRVESSAQYLGNLACSQTFNHLQ